MYSPTKCEVQVLLCLKEMQGSSQKDKIISLAHLLGMSQKQTLQAIEGCQKKGFIEKLKDDTFFLTKEGEKQI